MTQRRVQFMLCYGHADVPTRLDEGSPSGGPRSAKMRSSAPLRPAKEGRCTRSAAVIPLAVLEGAAMPRVSAASCARASPRSSPGEAGRAALRGKSHIVPTAHNAVLLLKTMALAGRGVAWLPLTRSDRRRARERSRARDACGRLNAGTCRSKIRLWRPPERRDGVHRRGALASSGGSAKPERPRRRARKKSTRREAGHWLWRGTTSDLHVHVAHAAHAAHAAATAAHRPSRPSASSATIASVVSSSEAIDAAFCSAKRVTLVGSTHAHLDQIAVLAGLRR